MTERQTTIPKLKIVNIDLNKHKEDFAIICPFGDTHIGNKHTAYGLIELVLDWIYKTENVYVIGMGDLLESATKTSVGTFDQDKYLTQQVVLANEYLKPIAAEGRLMGLLEGNHERRVFRNTGLDVTYLLAKYLNVDYFYKGIFLKINVIKGKNIQTYTFYATHGSSGAWTPSGKMNALYRLAYIADVDCYLMGHLHSLKNDKESRYTIENDEVVFRPRHYVLTGSYLTYWGSYAHQKSMRPSTDLGSPKIKLHTKLHRLSVHI